MGHCMCKERKRHRSTVSHSENRNSGGGRSRSSQSHRRSISGDSNDASQQAQPGTSRVIPGSVEYREQLLRTLGLDIKDLILETLQVIRTLVNNDQEPPAAMLKLNIIADRESGWLMIVQTMVDIVPVENPLGPAVITLFLDESPLPTKETVCKLLFYLNLSTQLSFSKDRPPSWHRNVCIVLGCIAEKLAGPNSVATFKPTTLEYLVSNLHPDHQPYVILFSLIALEKYAQTSENKVTITQRLSSTKPNPLGLLEIWLKDADYTKRQVGFCAQWALDNLFICEERNFSYAIVETKGINVMLNHNDVSEYLKISPNGLEARCDVSSFESVRCTCSVNEGCWYYEAVIITSGVMQIGWATKESKFLNHEGYGIGDDEFSIAYDGCRQLLWHNATSHPHTHPPWKPGDTLGCLLDLNAKEVIFSLNGVPLANPHRHVFNHAKGGFFAAASFMSFQQCEFNFGHRPFDFPPKDRIFQKFNDVGSLTDEQRIILPRHKKLEKLRSGSLPEDSCTLCYAHQASVILMPCSHSGLCSICAMVLEHCPFCRRPIEERRDSSAPSGPPTAQNFASITKSNSVRPPLPIGPSLSLPIGISPTLPIGPSAALPNGPQVPLPISPSSTLPIGPSSTLPIGPSSTLPSVISIEDELN